MKRFVLLILATSISVLCYAGGKGKQPAGNSAIEIALGGVSGLSKYQGTVPQMGIIFLAEYRYNLPESNLSFGLQYSRGYFKRFNNTIGRREKVSFDGSVISCIDYNYKRSERLTLFAGLGAGFAPISYEYPQLIANDKYEQKYLLTRKPLIVPRLGIEFKKIRFTIEYRIISKEFSCLGINLGYSLGKSR